APAGALGEYRAVVGRPEHSCALPAPASSCPTLGVMPMPILRSVVRVLAAACVLLLPAVADANENQPPHFTSTPYPVADIGHEYAYDAKARDPEDGTLHFGLLEAPDNAALDAVTGRFGWTPGNDAAGVHALAIEVQDPE